MNGPAGQGTDPAVEVGSGPFRYRVAEKWALPADSGFGEVAAVVGTEEDANTL